MQNIPFKIETVELEKSWSESIQMCVDHSRQPPPLNKGIMWFSLMIFLVDAGSISCRIRIKPSKGFVSSKPWLRKNLETKSGTCEVTMVESMSLKSLRTYVQQKELNESRRHPITHSRMGWSKGRIERLWEQLGRCCMTKAYHFICGLRHVIQRYTCRIEACIAYWGWRHQRRLSPGRDQMWVTSRSLAHRYFAMWPKMPERS